MIWYKKKVIKMAISKIKILLMEEKTICIFDVDGVLTPLEFGEYNHYTLNDEMWVEALQNDYDYYAENRPIKVMQDFIAKKDKQRIYVATRVMNEKELEYKKNFLLKQYGILSDHVFAVYNNENKLDVIKEIHKKYPELEEKYFVMIDDTVEILNHIMDHSGYSTMHISSFFE